MHYHNIKSPLNLKNWWNYTKINHKSIIYHLNSDNFPRIKVGVGKKPAEWEDLADWVLSRFTNDELKTLRDVAEKVCKNLPLMLDGKIDEAMNRMNS